MKEVKIAEASIDPFELKSKWMLVTAAKDDKVNTMTANWGGFGIMWNKDVVFIVVRPQRYTKEFIDYAESFTLTFFDKSYKKDLGYLGKVSGRDEDKIDKTNLTVAFDGSDPYFEEAELVVVAKKLYSQEMNEKGFLGDTKIPEQWYPEKDFHELYIAEITKVLIKE